MKKIIRFIGFIVLAWMMMACRSGAEEKALSKRQVEAEKQTAVLCEALMHNAPLDSIRSIAEGKDDLFFYGREAVEFFYTKADTAIRMGIHPWKVEIHRHKTYAGDNILCKYNVVEIKWNLESHID